MNKSLPVRCPGCGRTPRVVRLSCGGCGTAIEGSFALPVLARLDPEDQAFLVDFLKSSGSLKELARLHGISYPTVRNRLDSLIDRITQLEIDLSEQSEED